MYLNTTSYAPAYNEIAWNAPLAANIFTGLSLTVACQSGLKGVEFTKLNEAFELTLKAILLSE